MRITLNGSPHEIAGPTTVARLLETLGLPAARVAVQVNEDIVPRARHAETPIAGGDRVEVIAFSSGG